MSCRQHDDVHVCSPCYLLLLQRQKNALLATLLTYARHYCSAVMIIQDSEALRLHTCCLLSNKCKVGCKHVPNRVPACMPLPWRAQLAILLCSSLPFPVLTVSG
jgi:hypothetical protein